MIKLNKKILNEVKTMKILKSLKDFIFYGCTYYTAITVAMLIPVLDRPDKMPDAGRYMLFLMLSFIFALGSTLYRVDSINRPLAICLHAAIYNVGFLVFLAVSGMGFSSTIIGTLIFALCYTIITVVFRLIAKSMKKSNLAKAEKSATKTSKFEKKPEKNEYKNLFS